MAASPHLATTVTAWLCVALYLIAVVSRSRWSLSGRARRVVRGRGRILWSAACLMLAVHIATAFHFEHGWSHTAALRHTAEKTRATVGLNWGGGLYFNWLLLTLWSCDAALSWSERWARWPGTRRFHWLVELYCGFMMLNAAIVFGPVGEWLKRFVVG